MVSSLATFLLKVLELLKLYQADEFRLGIGVGGGKQNPVRRDLEFQKGLVLILVSRVGRITGF